VALSARTVDQDATQPGSLGEAPQSIEAIGGDALVVQTDLGNRADLQKLVDLTVARFGGIDVLVNNAAATTGSVWSKKFLDLTYEEWLHDFDINLHAPSTLMQLISPIMAARGGGRIVYVTTASGDAFRMVEEPVPPASVVGRWEFPLSRTACFKRQWRVFSEQSLK
jgi:NAD(P)-dependent dehydrogenase (short-subunit alcohol dehydrogenase family)